MAAILIMNLVISPGDKPYKMSKNIIIVDNHVAVLRGLKYLIKEHFPSFSITAVKNGQELLDRLRAAPYDLLIFDLGLPDVEPILFITTIQSICPNLDILVYSAYPETLFAKRMISLGVKGFVEKNSPESELIKAMREILAGGIYLSREMNKQMLLDSSHNHSNPFDNLSNREFEVALLVTKGFSFKEIRTMLNLQPSTIATYKSRVFEKLNVSSVAELVRLAGNYGLG